MGQRALDGLEIFKRLKDAEVFAINQTKGTISLKSALMVEMEHLLPIVLNSQKDARELFPWEAIDYLRTLKRPPKPVRFLMEAICILKEIQPVERIDKYLATIEIDYWEPARKFLASRNLIAELKEFEEGRIDPEILEVFQMRFIGNPNFEREIMERAFPPLAGLHDWLFAIERFTVLANLMREKKDRYEQLEVARKRSLEDLMEIRRNLRFVTQEMKRSVANNEGLSKKFPIHDEIVYLVEEPEMSEVTSEEESLGDFESEEENINLDLRHRIFEGSEFSFF